MRVLAGRSLSVALAVKLSRLPSTTFLLRMAASTGAWLASVTETVKVSLSLPPAPSLTVMVIS